MGRGVFTGFYELCAFNRVTMVTNQGKLMQILLLKDLILFGKIQSGSTGFTLVSQAEIVLKVLLKVHSGPLCMKFAL